MSPGHGDTTISSATLLRARDGDDSAWEHILNVYENRVFRQIFRSGIREPDASELAATVFSAAFEKLQTFSRNRPDQHMGKWLGTVTFHTIVNHWRQTRKNPVLLGSGVRQLAVSEADSTVIDCVVSAVERAALAAAIEELSLEYENSGKAQHWNCFWMHAVECRTSGDVARALNVSVSYVTSTTSRVRKRLSGVARSKYRQINGESMG